MKIRDEHGGLLSIAAKAIDLAGLRHSRIGRQLIALLNVAGQRGVRLLYLRPGTAIDVDGHKMFLSERHAPSLGFVSGMAHGRYEPEMRGLLHDLIREGMTVIDVGAHVGHYTLMAARIVGPRGRVYAFEAEPENYRILRKNVELNGYTNVTCIPKAVADRAGIMTLYVSHQGNDRHTVINDPRATTLSNRCEVETISLDEFVESAGWPRIDVLKMDIEGAEPLAVAGMSKLLARNESLSLVIEFAPEILRAGGADPEEFLSELENLGLSIAPVEADMPEDALHPANLRASLAEIERRGAINVVCRRRPVPETSPLRS
jgi:FkbM family methyltransferase